MSLKGYSPDHSQPVKFALGFQFLNEASWLKLHLPVMLDSGVFDGVIAVDGGSEDGSADIIRDVCQGRVATLGSPLEVAVADYPWQFNFGEQQNRVIDVCESLGYTHYFKWDPDELLFPRDLKSGREMLEHGAKAIKINRLNFEEDRLHYSPYEYPDIQTRFYELHVGIHWRGKLHASTNVFDLFMDRGDNRPGMRYILYAPNITIYHYEGIKPLGVRWLKWHNYERTRNDLPVVDEIPENATLPTPPLKFVLPFTGPQPLEPVNPHAPYSSEVYHDTTTQ